MKISAVIGCNYGDEGKGLVTDWLTSQSPNPIIVRYNGGAQAGHTVVTPDGKRHVFHHFGSGSFLPGASTFLSEYFITSPIFYVKEYKELEAIGVTPDVTIDKSSEITTPFDVMINQAIEDQRGKDRHGSCGMGINETVERSSRGFKVPALTLDQPKTLRELLHSIRTDWVPKRIAELGIVDEIEHIHNDKIIEKFLEDCEHVRNTSTLAHWHDLLPTRDLIFEGAQGLQLDQDNWQFPHVTRSKTGLWNIAAMLNKAKLSDQTVDVYYVTRSYFTRHGEGPFHSEVLGYPYSKATDNTNIEGDFQGQLRYGWLYLDELAEVVSRDTRGVRIKLDHDLLNTNLVITHCDQLEDDGLVKYMLDTDQLSAKSISSFAAMMKELLGLKKVYLSKGPTRDHISLSTDPMPVPELQPAAAVPTL